jgi:hypothetical protein
MYCVQTENEYHIFFVCSFKAESEFFFAIYRRVSILRIQFKSSNWSIIIFIKEKNKKKNKLKVLIVAVVLSVFVAATVAQHYTLGTDDATIRRQFGTDNDEEHRQGEYHWTFANDGTLRYRKSAPAYQSAPAPQYQQAVYAGPAQSYSYPSLAPQVKCPQNLLLSCQPNVAHVPCVAPPSYGKY